MWMPPPGLGPAIAGSISRRRIHDAFGANGAQSKIDDWVPGPKENEETRPKRSLHKVYTRSTQGLHSTRVAQLRPYSSIPVESGTQSSILPWVP